MKKKKNNSILRFLKLAYIKIFRINDTPQKIALGVGVGVFLGILPGTGPIAAVFMAFILRLNRAAALLGSLLTNTWLSVLTFFLSIKIGSSIIGLDWQEVNRNWAQFFKDFKFMTLFKVATLKIILPVVAGYFVISLCLGIIAYLVTLAILIFVSKAKRKAKYV